MPSFFFKTSSFFLGENSTSPALSTSTIEIKKPQSTKHGVAYVDILCMFAMCCMWAKSTSLLQIMTDSTAFVYPQPRRDETAIDDYHGTKVWHQLNLSLIQMLSRWRTHTNGWRTLTAVRQQSLSHSKMLCLSLTSTLARSVCFERIFLQWNL